MCNKLPHVSRIWEMQFLNIKFNVWEYTAALWTEINMFFNMDIFRVKSFIGLTHLKLFEAEFTPLCLWTWQPPSLMLRTVTQRAYLSCFKLHNFNCPLPPSMSAAYLTQVKRGQSLWCPTICVVCYLSLLPWQSTILLIKPEGLKQSTLCAC